MSFFADAGLVELKSHTSAAAAVANIKHVFPTEIALVE